MPSRRLFVVLALLITGTFSLGVRAAVNRHDTTKSAPVTAQPTPTESVDQVPSESPTPEPTDSVAPAPSESPTEAPTAAPTLVAEPPAPNMPKTGAESATAVAGVVLVGSAIVVRRARSTS